MNTNTGQAGIINRRPECDALAPLLALRGTGVLDAEETARVERHLATCDACQRDVALDTALASYVRDALIPPAQAAPALTLREIVQAAAMAEEEEMAAAERAASDAPEEQPGVARRGIHSQQSRAANRYSGLAALVAALAVVLLAAYIFGSHTGTGGTTHLGPVVRTATLSPMLAQETVYLPTADGIYALRASDGAVRWTFPAGITTLPVNSGQAIYGLSLDHATLYTLASLPGYRTSAYAQGPRLYALNAANGSVRWSVQVPDPAVTSLLQVGHLLVVAPAATDTPRVSVDDDTVFAFDTANGNLVWRRTLDEPTLSNAVAAGGSVYIGTTQQLVALNAADGTVRWTSPIVPGTYQQGTKLFEVNSSVALAVSGERVYALGKRVITPGDRTHGPAWEANFYGIATSDGTRLWRDTVENDRWDAAFAPTVVGDTAYVALGGGITAFSLDGASPQEQWRFIPRSNPDFSTSQDTAMTNAVVSGGVVYATDLTGVLAQRDRMTSWENCTYAVRASDGVELWRTPSDGGLMAAPPTVADGLLLEPAGDLLRVFDAGGGHPLWQYVPPGGSLTTSPLVGP